VTKGDLEEVSVRADWLPPEPVKDYLLKSVIGKPVQSYGGIDRDEILTAVNMFGAGNYSSTDVGKRWYRESWYKK